MKTIFNTFVIVALNATIFLILKSCTYAQTPNINNDTYPLGWFARMNTDKAILQNAVQNGTNTILLYGTGQEANPYRFVTLAEELGVKLVIDIHTHPGKFGLGAPISKFEEMAQNLKGNPTVLGYYIADEPQFNPLETPEYFKPLYDALRKGDPEQAIWMAHTFT